MDAWLTCGNRPSEPRKLAGLQAGRAPGLLAAALAIAAVSTVAACSTSAVASTAQPAGRDLAFVRSCAARPGWATITLTNTLPEPAVTVTAGAHVVVIVPGWTWGTATRVHAARSGILRKECTVLLPDRGRREIFLAVRPGSTHLGATVAPAKSLMMPAWGGRVLVRPGRG
jgi:hypothetical protein